MQYGTSKSTGPFVFSVTVQHEPRCPGCAEFLQPGIIVFFDGWAWCPVCLAMGLHCEPWIGVVLGDERMLQCSSVVNGLRFYTPDVVGGEAHSAFENAMTFRDELPISIVEPWHPNTFEVTPTGSRELAKIGKVPPMRSERDMWGDGTLPGEGC